MNLIKKIIAWFTSHPQTDAVVIGLSGAATFIFSSIYSVVHNPNNWHPESFGIGFASMATGIGALFFLKKSHIRNVTGDDSSD